MRLMTWAGLLAGGLAAAGCSNETSPDRNPVGSERTPPTVSITAPAAGAMTGHVMITVSASDASGIMQVQWKINGALLPTTDVAAPYEYDWDTAWTGPGTFTWQAIATDRAGNTGESALVTYTVGM